MSGVMTSILVKKKREKSKAQSAMEYLMTYGWAILIIAVVLAALFELGVFNGSNLAPQACIAESGFICKNPVYTANGITFTFGQTTGRDYYGDWVFVTVQGEALNSNGIPINFTGNVVNDYNAVQVGGMANVLIPGQTVQVDFPHGDFPAGAVPSNPTIGTPFAGYIWLGYCLSPCSAPAAYSKVATITIKSAAGFTGPTPTSTSTTSSTSTTTICTVNDPIGGYSGDCNVVFTATGSISGDIKTTGSITIDSSVTLTSNGHSFIAGGNFLNSGTIDTGQGTNTATLSTTSYGGSGGSGGVVDPYCGCTSYSANGGSTLASGGPGVSGYDTYVNGNGGSTPSAPAPLTPSLVYSWYQNGFYYYLTGAGGSQGVSGGCRSDTTSPTGQAGSTDIADCGSSGGNGGFGVYIQAYGINAGSINAAGGNNAETNNNGGGGGGGGVILLAYGAGGYIPGSYSEQGGSGYGSSASGGTGGAGQALHFGYGTSPPVPT